MPIAAHPSVHPVKKCTLAPREPIRYLHIADKARSQESTLQNIVAQNALWLKRARQNLIKRGNIDQALARKNTASEEILIPFGGGGIIGYQTARIRHHAREARRSRRGKLCFHTRHEDAVALCNNAPVFVDHRSVKRVERRRHQLGRRVERQDRIRVEREDIFHPAQIVRVTAEGAKGNILPAEVPYQRFDRTAFALLACVFPLRTGIGALPHDQDKAATMLAVELLDLPLAGRNIGGILRHDRRVRALEIGKHADFHASAPIRTPELLEMPAHFACLGSAGKQCRYSN